MLTKKVAVLAHELGHYALHPDKLNLAAYSNDAMYHEARDRG